MREDILVLSTFDDWASLPIWSVEEAVALSLGLRPRNYSRDNLFSLRSIKQYFDRLDFVQRHNSVGAFGECNSQNVFPGVFLSWLMDEGLECPQALIEEVKKAGLKIKRPQKQSKTKAKRGPKVKFEWLEFRTHLFRILEEHGNPMHGDDQLPNQAALEAKMMQWCEYEWLPCPGKTSIENYVRLYLAEWREQQKP